MSELPKAYEPQNYEDEIYKEWESSGYFSPEKNPSWIKKPEDPKRPHFSIVLPPPNVTGTLHMGHAAMLVIEDIMVRYHRMKGDRTVWVPGTDHAAVATESKVEGMLIKKGIKNPKQELGRTKFLDEVKKFAQESHDTIVNQCKKMGASLDWSREAYTLDEQRSWAVRSVFKKMYDDGLIYRGYRVVNWSTKGQSTCSDDELVYVERPAKLYFFKYSKDFPITIATTRPETKLGDSAVAVNPGDKRYKQYIGQTFTVDVGAAAPRKIKIVADEGVDMNFGTGALGVTPAHSITDFEIYERQKQAGDPIDLIQVIGEGGKMTKEAGQYFGMSVVEAREKFVKFLADNDLLEKEEDVTQNVGTSDRFGDVIEPLPKIQWWINVNKKFPFKATASEGKVKGIKDGEMVTLKELMQRVVKNGQIKIIPERFEKTYFHWIDNLRDWNISRQIWYGHRVPVYYCRKSNGAKCEEPIIGVGSDLITECKGCQTPLEQDPDTLDTWFSSGLWTFSTLGWPANADSGKKGMPGKENDFVNFHPTSVLETGYDILFFWVARMILMTTYTLGAIPFETVYLHGLVRDEQGRKMSKTLGNIIDPLSMIEKYGTDATRLSLVIGTAPGNDLKLSEEKISGFRNFANKLWNISRFIKSFAAEGAEKEIDPNMVPEAKTAADEWMLGRLQEIVKSVTENIEKYNFSFAGEVLRDFTWGELADWYLEVAKVEGNKDEMLNYVLVNVLKLWHPFMPFVTETIWDSVVSKDKLIIQKWPETTKAKYGKDFETIKEIISSIRSFRSENKIEPAKWLSASIGAGKHEKLIAGNAEVIKKLARLEKLEVKKSVEKQKQHTGFVVGAVSVMIDMGGAVDTGEEKARIKNEIMETEKYIKILEGKLSNKDFVSRAPASVVEGEKGKMEKAKDKMEKLQSQLKSLS